MDDYVTLTTNSTGGFKEDIEVPSIPVGSYKVYAVDDYGLEHVGGFDFIVALTTLAVSPPKGPTGTLVLLVGGGFTTAGVDWNATIEISL